MAKQFALSTRSFDKFQEKEAFSGILPEGISQNIILRVFVKHQETFFFRFFFKLVVNADGFSQNTRLNSFHGEHNNSPEHRNDLFGVFLGELFIFMDLSELNLLYFSREVSGGENTFFPV